MHMIFFSFLISLPLPLSIIKGRNTPGKPMREVSENQAHGHGFCLSHPAFYVWRLCKNCVRARACSYHTRHHVRMVATSPLPAHEEHSSNVHGHCHHHDDRTTGRGKQESLGWNPAVHQLLPFATRTKISPRNSALNILDESQSFFLLPGP